MDFLITLDMANRIAAVEQSEQSRVIRDFLWAAMREKQDVQETVEPAEQPPAVQHAPVIAQGNRTETENQSLSPFSFDGKSIRVIEVDGEPYWVVKDVLGALEYPETTINGSANKLIRHVPEEWKGKNRILTLGGTQELATLSEQCLYFFVARSDKPKAIPFQKWVAGEVLPTVWKIPPKTFHGDPVGICGLFGDFLKNPRFFMSRWRLSRIVRC